MRKHLSVAIAAATLIVLATAQPARADWLLTPFAGVSFGGTADTEKFVYGASVGWMGNGIAGVEFDAAITPRFLDRDDGIVVGIEESNVSTVMANFVIGAPMGSPGVRPYASAGAGILRLRATSVDNLFRLNDNSFGVNVGAGIVGFVSENFGLRLDVRYFRGIQDTNSGDDIDLSLDGFQFWRATAGTTFRF